MPALLTTIGLRAVPAEAPAVPLYAAGFLIANFFSTYIILASRHPKQWYGFDHNVAPREDIAKYGEALVTSGKLTRTKLNAIKRWNAASANAIENFPLFVAAVLMGTHAGVDHGSMNGLMTLYTLARLAYAVAYVAIENEVYSYLRSLLWWQGNLSCLTMLWLAGKRM